MSSVPALPCARGSGAFKGYLVFQGAPVLLTGASWKAHRTDGPHVGRDSRQGDLTLSVKAIIKHEDKCDRASCKGPQITSPAAGGQAEGS